MCALMLYDFNICTTLSLYNNYYIVVFTLFGRKGGGFT